MDRAYEPMEDVTGIMIPTPDGGGIWVELASAHDRLGMELQELGSLVEDRLGRFTPPQPGDSTAQNSTMPAPTTALEQERELLLGHASAVKRIRLMVQRAVL